MRRPLIITLCALLLAVAAGLTWANWPAPPLPADVLADRVVVYKSERRMALLSGDRVLREYRVALGFNPIGAKEREGDGRTPEGLYTIDSRNIHSRYRLALHISYPNAGDIVRAKRQGVAPGGMVMIHGLPSGMGLLGSTHRLKDWTLGCVAVTNPEIDEIGRLVPDGTVIELRQ